MSGQEIYEYNLGPSNSKHCKPMFHARLSCSIQPYTLQCIAEPFSRFCYKDPTGIGIKQKELRNIWFKTFFSDHLFFIVSLTFWSRLLKSCITLHEQQRFLLPFLRPSHLPWAWCSESACLAISFSQIQEITISIQSSIGLWRFFRVNDLRIHRILDRQVAQILVQCFQAVGGHSQVALSLIRVVEKLYQNILDS